MSKNKHLHSAKKEKNDEYYTLYDDIEKELKHYKDHFKDKIIYCNCDDPEFSNFWKYLSDNFTHYGLKKLISSHYVSNSNSYKLEISRDINGNLDTQKTTLKGNGDFRSEECVEILKEADIVITNCPFSLFRIFITQLIEYDKKFLIIGHQNAITYKEVFKLIKDNKLWLGVSPSGMKFKKSDGSINLINACWFTNLIYNKQHKDLILHKKYTPEEYPKYDNYDAINVDKVKDIPIDYYGCMGVPITYLFKHNPEPFEIKGIDRVLVQEITGKVSRFLINGKEIYARIVIKRNPEQFEIIDSNSIRLNENVPFKSHGLIKDKDGSVNGINKYARIVIKRKPEQFEIITLGIVGTCDFTCNKKMEILDKNGNPTGKFTFNAKGTLYRLYNPKTDKSPAFRNVETNELYTSIYARIIIKRKNNSSNNQ